MDPTDELKMLETEKSHNKKLPESPRWNNITKLVVGLTFVAILAGLLIAYNQFISPLLLTLIVSYLMWPLASFLFVKAGMSWRLSVTLLYLVMVLTILGLLFWFGLAIVTQVQSLLIFLQDAVGDVPQLIERFFNMQFDLGPWHFGFESLRTLNIGTYSKEIIGAAETLLSSLGGVIGSFASGAASTFGWLFFILWVSYFIVVESEGVRSNMINLRIPGFEKEFARLGKALGKIWNAFLRGQMIIFFLTVAVYSVLLGALGVRYFFGLAMLAGLARFVPYLGPTVAWTVYALVAIFQGSNPFDLSPILYAAVIVGAGMLTDSVMDNIVVVSIMGNTLSVHPAAIMITALVGASVFGIIGFVIGAPIAATLKLISVYVMRKMFDQDPWMAIDVPPPPRKMPRWLVELQRLYNLLKNKFHRTVPLPVKETKHEKSK